MGLWDREGSHRETSEEKLRRKLSKNMYYPFTCVDETKNKRVFVLRRRDKRIWNYLAIAAISFIFTIIFLIFNLITTSYFLVSMGSLLASAVSAWSLRDIREYYLNEKNRLYRFSVGNTILVEERYSNIYIRLRKRYDFGRANYYLVLNGYHAETYLISGISREPDELRILGKEIACNLFLNYFDEQNNSTKHVIRHFPERKMQRNNISPHALMKALTSTSIR